MDQAFSAVYPSTLGTNVGADSDGVLIGVMTPANPTKVYVAGHAAGLLCITDDGGSYASETAAMADATGDDVEILPATPADDDAFYLGHATVKFGRVDVNITTQGVGTWDIVYEYWNGQAFEPLTVVDGTEGMTAETGWKSITFSVPGDWQKNTVDSVNAYWIRGVVDNYSAVTTAPQIGQGFAVLETPTYTNETTDATDADTGDFPLLPAYPVVGDGTYYVHTEKFCRIKVTHSQARTGTATLGLKYWNGSEWTVVPVASDESVGFSASAGTYFLSFSPPGDWEANTAANGIDGQAGYTIGVVATAITSVTQQPLGTRAWVVPLITGAEGPGFTKWGKVSKVCMNAITKSGTTKDSIFLAVNCTTGKCGHFTWTKAMTCDADTTLNVLFNRDDMFALMQIQEDGTTEFANANFWFYI